MEGAYLNAYIWKKNCNKIKKLDKRLLCNAGRLTAVALRLRVGKNCKRPMHFFAPDASGWHRDLIANR